ncbi:MAG: tRNA (N(6)-L-threonylcarbamoyladenosine(37)-C(2))-methylthiotransferase MtaB [Deltaproteobacteria bacterium]|nr:tRNA (N(6)-L-threonylcarbamoyladenosine(37)-C(2))-methylthiotransferase MtaB [Deltaproteobacteria bacterium]
MKYSIFTTGCRANQYDSWVVEEKLKKAGFGITNPQEADVVIVNSCTVTENAEKDIRRFIFRTKSRNPKAKIVLMGCHAQVYPERNFGADLVLGQKEKFNFLKHIKDVGILVGQLENNGAFDDLPYDFSVGSRTRFFLKIQDGCSKYCTYCIVPFARGKPRSRSLTDILRVMRELKVKGIKEVVLTGIEIASYYDESSGTDLKGLLRIIENSETPERIRLSSIDPLYIDSEFVKILASSKKLAPSIHLPLQSGSESILEKMGRNYTTKYILEIVRELKTSVKNISVGLDIIAGFPQEGDSEFAETLKCVKSLDAHYLHVFPFSPRDKTIACKMKGMVEPDVKKSRVKVLKELDRELRFAFYRKYLGYTLRILPEKKLYEGKYLRGFSENYIPVFVEYKEEIINRFVEIKIKEIKGGRIFGEVLE